VADDLWYDVADVNPFSKEDPDIRKIFLRHILLGSFHHELP
jgi:hypothetical protein